MSELVVAAAVFLGIHLVSSTPLRGVVVRRLGEHVYRGLFSAASVAAIVWLAMAYNAAPVGTPLWLFGDWARYAAIVLVFAGMVFVVCGLTIRNPSAAGFEGALATTEPARGILRVTRHPFLWGAGLWGVAHLLNNGDAASVVFFATFTVLAFAGTVLVDIKKRKSHGPDWQRFEAVTSNIPFAAILAGRNRLSLGEIGALRILLVIVVFVAFLHGHGHLFGVSPMPLS